MKPSENFLLAVLVFIAACYVAFALGYSYTLFTEPPEGNFTTIAELDQQEIMSLRHDIQDIGEQPTP